MIIGIIVGVFVIIGIVLMVWQLKKAAIESRKEFENWGGCCGELGTSHKCEYSQKADEYDSK